MENKRDMPMGFAFQLSMNERAMENFAQMADSQKEQIIEKARNVTSKEQVRQIVDDISRMS